MAIRKFDFKGNVVPVSKELEDELLKARLGVELAVMLLNDQIVKGKVTNLNWFQDAEGYDYSIPLEINIKTKDNIENIIFNTIKHIEVI